MSKNLDIVPLLDIYSGLLSPKQAEIMDYYYNQDFSLGEISEIVNITRQGVRDSVKRSEEILLEADKAVGVAKIEDEHRKQLVQAKTYALDAFEQCKKISYAKPVADKLITLLMYLDELLGIQDNE